MQKGGDMIEQSNFESEIVARCVELELGVEAPKLIRNFIHAAFYHAYVLNPPLADRNVAIFSALRNATLRIACGWGRSGGPFALCRNLSGDAIRLRDDILKGSDRGDATAFVRWKKKVTIEHHDPLKRVWEWIENSRPSEEEVVLQLLRYPVAIISRDEDRRLNKNGMRTSGNPEERYAKADISLHWQSTGALSLFQSELGIRKIQRRSKYDETLSQTVTSAI
jgi:hypothetical protein